jgi:hypothetical protein
MDMVSYNKQNSTNPANPWAGGLLLVEPEQIQGWLG